jgi:hypothetical protein
MAMHHIYFFFMQEFTFTLQRDFIQSSRAKAISACGRVTSTLLVAGIMCEYPPLTDV